MDYQKYDKNVWSSEEEFRADMAEEVSIRIEKKVKGYGIKDEVSLDSCIDQELEIFHSLSGGGIEISGEDLYLDVDI